MTIKRGKRIASRLKTVHFEVFKRKMMSNDAIITSWFLYGSYFRPSWTFRRLDRVFVVSVLVYSGCFIPRHLTNTCWFTLAFTCNSWNLIFLRVISALLKFCNIVMKNCYKSVASKWNSFSDIPRVQKTCLWQPILPRTILLGLHEDALGIVTTETR